MGKKLMITGSHTRSSLSSFALGLMLVACGGEDTGAQEAASTGQPTAGAMSMSSTVDTKPMSPAAATPAASLAQGPASSGAPRAGGDGAPTSGASNTAMSTPPAGGSTPADAADAMQPTAPPADMAQGGMDNPGDDMQVPSDGMPSVDDPQPSGEDGDPGSSGDWGEQDATADGPFDTTTENNVGPGGEFTMYRPDPMMGRHPVITWGNGTGTTPRTYNRMLSRYASHGFIVIASNSMNVGRGDPPPMLQGVTWVLEQDMESGSALFEHVDRDNIGATGHSQGAFATSAAGRDERVTVTAPIQGARSGTLHGPSLILCGGMDTIVPCSGSDRAFNAINSVPVMYANLKAIDHISWIGQGANSEYAKVTLAWFRLHLMGDMSQRGQFYGSDCTLCQDSAWEIRQKMLD